MRIYLCFIYIFTAYIAAWIAIKDLCCECSLSTCAFSVFSSANKYSVLVLMWCRTHIFTFISGLTVVHKIGHLHKCFLAWTSNSNYTLCQNRTKQNMHTHTHKKVKIVSFQNSDRVTCKQTVHASSSSVAKWLAKLWSCFPKPLKLP